MPPLRSPLGFGFLTVLLGLLTVCPPVHADEPSSPENLHLFLLVGQSNMAGRGTVTEADRKPHPRVLSFNKQGEWVPAIDPLHFDKPKVVGVGLGRTFGIAYADDHPEATVGLIPCAVGGSPIRTWESGVKYDPVGVNPYDDALRRAKAALKNGTLKGILWHQGESDSSQSEAPKYEERLRTLIDRLRKELDAPNVPVLIGQLGQFPEKPADRWRRLVDHTHWEVARTTPRAGFVSSTGLKHGGDKVHFSADAYREFGRRYYAAFKTQETAPTELDPKTTPKVQQRFLDGRAAIMPPFEDAKRWIRHDLWVESPNDCDRDGKPDRIHIAVTRQAETKSAGLQVPAIIFMSPYYGRPLRLKPGNFWNMRHPIGEWAAERDPIPYVEPQIERPVITNRHINDWVPRGYAVVHASSPGTGLSQGCATVGGDNEYEAPKAVVDWLCGRAKGFTEPTGGKPVTADWCTGKIAMSGTSYNGTLSLAGAMTGVEGLEVVIPVAPNTSYYHYYRSNGLIRHPKGYLGEEIDVLGEAILLGKPKMWERCLKIHRDELFIEENVARTTGDWNEFWHGRDMLPRMKPMRAAMLMSHGFNDWNVVPEHSIRIYEEAKRLGIPAALYMHQGGHGGPPPKELMNLWFTHFLFGVENDWDEGGRSWIVRERDSRDKPTRYDDYPHPEAEPVAFHMTPGAPQRGGLSAETKPQGEAKETFVDNFSFTGEMLAQAEWTRHRLIYLTDTLTAPVHISGTPTIELELSCDQPAANISAWLVALPWEDGRQTVLTDNLITRGWADPQNHESISKSEPLTPGKRYRLKFPLQPDDQIIAKGQQIALLVYGSDKEFTILPDPGTKVTLHLGDCKLTLPIVGGETAWKKATTPEKQDENKEGDSKETEE